jgi:hypothetical protein
LERDNPAPRIQQVTTDTRMSSYEMSPPTSPGHSPQNSMHARSVTPDIIEPVNYASGSGGFNLADELAMAEESETEDSGFLGPAQNRTSIALSDYEGSEYGDIDNDSDGYLDNRVDVDAQALADLISDFTEESIVYGVIGQFIDHLRNMRGQMDVENHARRYAPS